MCKGMGCSVGCLKDIVEVRWCLKKFEKFAIVNSFQGNVRKSTMTHCAVPCMCQSTLDLHEQKMLMLNTGQ